MGRDRRNYLLASQQFTQAQPTLLKTVLETSKENGNWIAQNIQAVSQRFSKDISIDQAVRKKAYKRRSWQVCPVDAQIQQFQHDAFLPTEAYAEVFSSAQSGFQRMERQIKECQ